MNIRSAYFLAGALLISAPFSAISAPRDDKGDALRTIASRVGRALGAASACPGIAQPRVKGISGKLTAVITSSSRSEDESRSVLELFNASYGEGARDVNARRIDCATADRELADLEKVSGSSSQMSAAATIAQPTAFATQLAAGPIHGITDSEIRFGASLPLTGPNKDYGHQIKVGIETAFRMANDAGGINGRMLRLIVADDGYEPTRTTETMKQLYDKEQVFGFVGNFGTATSMVAAPFALERQSLFYAAYTGANVLRRDPPDRYVFNYRASYAEETEAAVRYLVKVRRIKPEQIAVFAQQDAYGDAGFAGVAKAMRALRGGDGGFILRTAYPRNSLDVDAAIAQLKASKTPIKAVVMVATYRAAAKFIDKSREVIPGLIYTNPSAVGSTSLREELMLLGPQYAKGVIVTQVVPAVDGYSSLILEYKAALAKYFGGEAPDYVSFEYYIASRILVEALKRSGPQLDSEKLVETLENIRDLDLGLGTAINFNKSEHQGSHKVWGTELNEAGNYEPIELQ
jgi:ABC-type branched-subunit amino acid transport system substrate-binding protein